MSVGVCERRDTLLGLKVCTASTPLHYWLGFRYFDCPLVPIKCVVIDTMLLIIWAIIFSSVVDSMLKRFGLYSRCL